MFVRQRVQTDKVPGIVMILHISIFMFLESKEEDKRF